MKKILIALNYDPSAQKIAETGYSLATAMNARVILLHVISDASSYASLNYSPIMGADNFNNLNVIEPVITDELLKKTAQEYLDKSKKHLGDENIETIVRDGDFGNSILEVAAEMNVDVIVMGSHGRSGLDKILMGSIAEKVLHHSSIPLFIIPTRDLTEKK
jgi:nucleotide-binding universal stress UspA family protein